MKLVNPTVGIVRIDADETEYLFVPGVPLDVAPAHVARVFREHPELEPFEESTTKPAKGA